jgi:OOP family OmpA-OmpF porin
MKAARLIGPVMAIGALAALPGTASADTEWWQMDQPAFYVGGGIGYNWLTGGRIQGDDLNQPDDLSGSNVSYKGIFGFRFNRILGLEGQYINFGTNDDGDNQIDADGWTAMATAALPLDPHFIPYAKAGMLFWNSNRRFPAGPGTAGAQQERDGDGTDFAWGAGMKFPVNQNVDFRLEYERLAFGDIDRVDDGSDNFDHIDGAKANMVSGSVVFSF